MKVVRVVRVVRGCVVVGVPLKLLQSMPSLAGFRGVRRLEGGSHRWWFRRRMGEDEVEG